MSTQSSGERRGLGSGAIIAIAAMVLLALVAAFLLFGGDGDEPAALGAAATTEAGVPTADPGRGVMLTQRADAIQQRIDQAVADGRLDAASAAEARADLEATRETLTGLLTANPGPLPQEQRTALAQRLAALESRLP